MNRRRLLTTAACTLCVFWTSLDVPAAQPVPPPGAGPTAVGSNFLLPEFAAALALRPKDLLEKKLVSFEESGVLLYGMKDKTGLDPKTMEHLLVLYGPRPKTPADAKPQPDAMGLVLHFTEPASLEKLAEKNGLTKKQQGAFTYYCPDGPGMCLGLLQPTLLLAAEEADLLRMIERKPVDTPLSRILNKADRGNLILAFAAEPMMKHLLAAEDAFPPVQALKGLLEQLEDAQLTLSSNVDFQLALNCKSPAAANQTLTMLKTGVAMATIAVDSQTDVVEKRDPPAFRGGEFAFLNAASKLLPSVEPMVDGRSARIEIGREKIQAPLSTALTSIIAAFSNFQNMFDGVGESILLSQLDGALKEHLEDKGRFPPAYSVDKGGKPLLSWRVHILPYLGQAELFEKFKLDEAWDSPHNKKLLAEIPTLYRPADGVNVAEGKTQLLAVRGNKSLLAAGTGWKKDQVSDGLHQTVMVLMVPPDLAVEWTKPDDFTWNREKPAAGLFPSPQSTVTAMMADGSVLKLPKALSDESFRRLFTIDSGKKVALPAKEFGQPFEPGDPE